MNALLVGVVGHVDHGKTALVRALTGVETDRLPEEKARGVSIVPGFAVLRGADATGGESEIDLVDLPGHERFVRAMISGATGMRAVLLAVDVREGIRPQTVEHLEIARLIGVRRGVVALTKCDLADEASVAARGREVAAAAARAGIADPVLVPTSARTGRGIEAVARALRALAAGAPRPADDGFPYLPIDRAFARPGFGCVVTGTLRRGPLALGDRLTLAPHGPEASVRGLQVHGRPVAEVEPGRRAAVALRGIELGDLARGGALVAPGLLAPTRWIDVELEAVADGPPLASGSGVRLLFATAEVSARLRLLDRDALAPGERAPAQLHVEREVAVPAREPFVLRLDAPPTTVGGGRVLDPLSRRRRRRDPVVTSGLAALAAGGPAEALAHHLAAAGGAGLPLADLARRVGVAPERVRRGLAAVRGRDGAREGTREVGERVVAAAAFAGLCAAVLETLARHHRDHPIEHGLPLDRLARAIAVDARGAGAEIGVVEAALRDLAAAREVVQAGPLFRRADFDPGRHETAQVRQIEAAFRTAGLNPPDEAGAVGPDPRRREALAYLVTAGVLVRTVDRVQKRTILFHRDAIARARALLAAAFPGARTPETGFLAREAGAALGTSRKFSIPLLEHLDKAGFTRRAGDRRFLASP